MREKKDLTLNLTAHGWLAKLKVSVDKRGWRLIGNGGQMYKNKDDKDSLPGWTFNELYEVAARTEW